MINLFCYLFYIFLSIYIFINKNNKYDILYLILLIFLFIINYNKICTVDNIFVYILISIFIIINLLSIYINNFSNIKICIMILVITYLYFSLKINSYNSYMLKISINLLILVIYFLILNITIKLNNISKKIQYIKYTKTKPQKIRVALCVSGRIEENFEKIYKSWKTNLLDFYDVDIFMNIDKNNDYIKNVLKPKKIVIFNGDINKKNHLLDNSNLMFYRIYECNKYSIEYEKQNNFTYDIIIRIRSDILLFDRLYLENFNENLLYFPSRTLFEFANIYNMGVTDQFYISNRYLMNKICDIYLILENEKYKDINCKIPEILLLYYLRQQNLEYKYFKYNWMINYYYENSFDSQLKTFSKIQYIFNNGCYITL
jgi:hypothetical protein